MYSGLGSDLQASGAVCTETGLEDMFGPSVGTEVGLSKGVMDVGTAPFGSGFSGKSQGRGT